MIPDKLIEGDQFKRENEENNWIEKEAGQKNDVNKRRGELHTSDKKYKCERVILYVQEPKLYFCSFQLCTKMERRKPNFQQCQFQCEGHLFFNYQYLLSMTEETNSRVFDQPQLPTFSHSNPSSLPSSLELQSSDHSPSSIRNSPLHTQTNSQVKDLSMEDLRKLYESKIIENCQRTTRVILICQLEKRLNSRKQVKQKLNEILGQFVDRVNGNSDEEFERQYSGKYYKSLNYSRVKMGQKVFEKEILFNSLFREDLMEIFQKPELFESTKPRKNERSKISFEQRKKILSKLLAINQANFLKSFTSFHTEESSNGGRGQENMVEEEKKEVQMEIEIKMSANLLKVTQPVVCIPLKFEEYQEYMKSKGFH